MYNGQALLVVTGYFKMPNKQYTLLVIITNSWNKLKKKIQTKFQNIASKHCTIDVIFYKQIEIEGKSSTFQNFFTTSGGKIHSILLAICECVVSHLVFSTL